VSAVELVANSDQLSAFEFGHAQAAPAFSRADQCGTLLAFPFIDD
jgi:hypothetical protein